MPEFSQEYYQINGIKKQGDFSYMEFFIRMKNLETVARRCDGFGTIGIKNVDEVPFLIKSNKKEVNLHTLLQKS